MGDNKEVVCYVCANCQNINNINNDIEDKCEDKCRRWLDKNVNSEDLYSVQSKTSDGNSFDVSDITDDTRSEDSDLICHYQLTDGQLIESIEQLRVNDKVYKNISLTKCKKVHMGNVTNIYGPVIIDQKTQQVIQTSTINQIFLNGTAKVVPTKTLSIVQRLNWLAQPPVEDREYLQCPVKYVIISHTATERGFTQAENTHLVRLIQTFHIESKKWSDIAYNFLVGCDGKVYEGRGWGVVGAHTLGYNRVGIGISFIGCYLNVLPTDTALEQAKALIKRGVEMAQIDKDYVLVGHCQCCPTESPGKLLYDEIKTWNHWGEVDSH
ncbi:hypothetical protein FQA39_LY06554 [Lamprigera yunnana]|nr:hypothetical protein FQA39_LY06554 [Lamprigera yunnana]